MNFLCKYEKNECVPRVIEFRILEEIHVAKKYHHDMCVVCIHTRVPGRLLIKNIIMLFIIYTHVDLGLLGLQSSNKLF